MTPPAAPPDTDWSTFGAEINLLDGVSAMRPEKGWRAARGRRRRPVRRLWRRPLLWTLGGFAVLGLLSLIPAMGIRSGLERGRESLEVAQARLLDGDVEGAAVAFADARDAFASAAHQPGNVLLELEGMIPFVGRTPDAMVELAHISEDVAAAGSDVAHGVARLPAGLSSLGPSGTGIPLDALQELAPSIARMRHALEDARRRADLLPSSFVLPQIRTARDLLRQRLGETAPVVASADALLRAIPVFAGEDAPKRYFLAAQDNAELRGTGGLIGNFAILTLQDGWMKLSPFRDTWDLPTLPAEDALSPSPEFEQLYGPFGGGGFWLNINMTPDAPTAATLIEDLYHRVEGIQLDGTIFVDLRGLSFLLEATGPVDVPELDARITADSLGSFVANAEYLPPELRGNTATSSNRPELEQGPKYVAQAIWGAFLARGAPDEALRAVVRAAAGGHMVLHSTDADVQRAFVEAGVAGQLAPARGYDFFGAVVTNASANKVDFFTERSISYQVSLEDGGGAEATATVSFRNTVPADVEPSYAMGPFDSEAVAALGMVAGENRSWTAFYRPADARLESARVDGRRGRFEVHSEKGLPVLANFFRVKPQQTRRFTFEMVRDRGWSGDRTAGTYRLRLHGQPTMEPTAVTVAIDLPEGMSAIESNVPMSVEGSRVVWRGELTKTQDVVVRFGTPLPATLWTRVWDFLTRPIARV